MAAESASTAWLCWRRDLARWQRNTDAWLAELEARRATLGGRRRAGA